jgi:hypothetical protein|tara:strand:+ start:570 stop:2231 length:1662 start_codon:yes stop_codon:yes gene_type:complete
MGWWEDYIKPAAGGVFDFATTGTSGNSIGDFLLQSGIGAAINSSGLNTPNIPAVGYQGGIPEYEAMRERVPTDPDRRVGGQNQRYFTDMQYATSPEGKKAPTMEEAQAISTAQRDTLAQQNKPPQAMAAGGIASAHQGYYLGGKTDGMADEVPATIDGTQEARLSDGEFVVPADVVSHLGNGNSDAGADQLHGMMDNVRMERTGNSEQGKQIDPNKFMPTMAQGGIANAYNYGGSVRKFEEGGTTSVTDVGKDPNVGQQTGTESSLSSWAGPYVTDMLGRGAALGDQGYQGFGGPLTAGTSDLQTKSFEGIGALKTPETMGAYTPQTFGAEQATAGMNPYLMSALNPQLDEARRQSEISRVANAGRMTQAGAFGGSRQALMDMENQRNLETNLADITGKGYASAYDRAQQQFNTQQDRNMQAQTQANQYGFDVLGGQATAGAAQRGIEQQGLSADKSQFEEERDFPYKQVQYMQSLLQGLPLEAQSFSYSQPSAMQNFGSATGGVASIMEKLYGDTSTEAFDPSFGSATPSQIATELAANPNMTPAQIKAKYP